MKTALPQVPSDDRDTLARLGNRLGDLATQMMDEERLLEATAERKALLADFADFRAPLGLALGHLRGYRLTGDTALKADFDRGFAKAAASLGRIAEQRALLTATQSAAFGNIEADFAQLTPVVARLSAESPPAQRATPAREGASLTLATSLSHSLTRMLDIERGLPATSERKELLAQIADVRGPLGIATTHLRDYLVDASPASRWRFGQFCDRAAVALARLRSFQSLLSPQQAQAFAEVLNGWDRFGETAQAAMNRRDEAMLARYHFLGRMTGVAGAGLFLSLSALIVGLTAPLAPLALACLAAQALLALAAFAGLHRHWRHNAGLVPVLLALSRGEPAPAAPAGPVAWPLAQVGRCVDDLGALLAATQADHRRHLIERRAAMQRLSDRFTHSLKETMAALEVNVATVREQIQSLRSFSTRLEQDAGAADRASGGASQALATIAAALHECTLTAEDVGQQVHRSSSAHGEAGRLTARAGSVVAELAEVGSRIGTVSGMIESVTEQLQILALNASIEASHAGESGRGFATVAANVKQLATTTMQMTADIRGHVDHLHTRIVDTTTTIHAIERVMQSLSETVTGIDTAIAQQTAATREIATATERTTHDLGQMNGALTTLWDGARTAREATERLEALADALGSRAGDIHDRSNALLTGIRTS